jgi:hypothetical protein
MYSFRSANIFRINKAQEEPGKGKEDHCIFYQGSLDHTYFIIKDLETHV